MQQTKIQDWNPATTKTKYAIEKISDEAKGEFNKLYIENNMQ